MTIEEKQKRVEISPQQHLAEAVGLVKSLEWECVCNTTINVRDPKPSTLFGQGQLEDIRMIMQSTGAKIFIVNTNYLSPVQERNLTLYFEQHHIENVKVLDRFSLINHIFAERAQSKESKLQLELASLKYQKTRLIRTEKVANEKQASGVGTMGGFGETQLEIDKRKIAEREKTIKKDLEKVVRTRQITKSDHLPVVALVGYTNCGKSALLNQLTGLTGDSASESCDKLFTSLDPHTRGIILKSGKNVLLVDTVGFISELPEIFKTCFTSTLEKVKDADLLLHVMDSSNTTREYQRQSVLDILKEMDCEDKLKTQCVQVWNKMDILDEDQKKELLGAEDKSILISALEGTNCDKLADMIESELGRIEQERENKRLEIPEYYR